MNDSLANKLKNLRLAGIVQTVDMRSDQAVREKLSYIEFLELLVNDEYLNRNRNRISNLRKDQEYHNIRLLRNSTSHTNQILIGKKYIVLAPVNS